MGSRLPLAYLVAARHYLPAELDPESATIADLRGFDTELPERLKYKMFTSDLIFGLWFVWIPAVLLLCFATACLLPQGTSTPR